MTRPIYEQGLQAWVASIMTPLGFDPTIYSDGGKPRPIPPYATLRVLSDVSVYQPERSTTYDAGEDEVTRSVKLTREGTLSVNVFGDGHNQAALKLVASAYDQDTLDLLATYGLAIFDGGIQRLSTDSDGVTEPRSLAEFSFRYAFVDAHIDSNWIETVTLTGTYD